MQICREMVPRILVDRYHPCKGPVDSRFWVEGPFLTRREEAAGSSEIFVLYLSDWTITHPEDGNLLSTYSCGTTILKHITAKSWVSYKLQVQIRLHHYLSIYGSRPTFGSRILTAWVVKQNHESRY